MTEDLVRDLLSEQARAVPTDVDLLRGVAAQRRVRRRRRLVSGTTGIAVVLALAAVGTTVAVRHGSPVTRNGPAVSSALTTYPVGTRPVTWDGVQLDVPAAWTTAVSDPHRCAAQDAKPGGEVDYAGSDTFEAYGCRDATHPVRQRLELGTDYSLQAFAAAQAGPPGTLESTPTTLAGYAARRVQVGMLGQLVTKITVPQLKTDFTLTTNTSAEVSAIVATARVVDVDENGCPISEPSGFPSTTGGSSGPVLSSTPAGGVVCDYADGQLTTGTTLDTATTAVLTAALRRLPATYTDSELAAQRDDRQIMKSATAQLTLRDADGHVQRITVAGGTSPMVAGAHRSALTSELFFDLSGALPGTFGGAGTDGAATPDGCQSCGIEKAPPPTRPVTYRGITLNVPATWSSSTLACGDDRHYRGGVVTMIGPVDRNVLDLPSSCFDGLDYAGSLLLLPGSIHLATPVTFGGDAATSATTATGAAARSGLGGIEVSVPAVGASYTVTAPQPAQAAAIVATARFVDS